MRGIKSRIQQAPMMSLESSCRAIPVSVEFVNGLDPARELQLQSRSSQPIPIKTCRPSAQELEEEAASADSATQYDWATWRMYSRITAARRLRAVTRTDYPVQHQHQSIEGTQDYHSFAQERMDNPEESVVSHHGHLGQQPSPEEEDADDGVFAFDAI